MLSFNQKMTQEEKTDPFAAGGPPGEGEDGGFVMYFFILCLLRYRLRGPPSGSFTRRHFRYPSRSIRLRLLDLAKHFTSNVYKLNLR